MQDLAGPAGPVLDDLRLSALADLDKAYERLSHPFLFFLLDAIEVPAWGVAWIRMLLQGMYMRIKTGNRLGGWLWIARGIKMG